MSSCPSECLSLCHSDQGAPGPSPLVILFLGIILFVYFWLLGGVVALRGLSLVAVNRGFSLVVVHGLLVAEAPFAQGS